MSNWRFGAFPKLPYSTMQQLNLDWILDRIRRFLPDTGTKGQVLTRTKDGAAWVDPEAASGAVSSVNGKTGAVILTASDVGALPSSYQAPVTSVNGMTGDVIIQAGGGAVDSVNGQTGDVVLTAADVGALPESYVPPAAPVQSVNGQTGAVQLTIPDSTSDLTNDSGFVTAAQAAAAAPVQSVNGQTGAVQLTIPDSTSDLTNDSGFVTAAQAAAAAPVQSVNGQTGAVVIPTSELQSTNSWKTAYNNANSFIVVNFSESYTGDVNQFTLMIPKAQIISTDRTWRGFVFFGSTSDYSYVKVTCSKTACTATRYWYNGANHYQQPDTVTFYYM